MEILGCSRLALTLLVCSAICPSMLPREYWPARLEELVRLVEEKHPDLDVHPRIEGFGENYEVSFMVSGALVRATKPTARG